ncbi:hypothetical protein COY62_02485 [bacterium (Candidatus Howlettbacteria) CG_4_10_14_0_8_um_filter_40_9]|nr:MAG: hypothetical protein COY62_02485 [bacterium (Candidatus Howlettbacteria) CG_4_10_14_0_8_um_filter_40_9]
MWDYTKNEYSKQAEADVLWRLEREINYGFGKKKLDKTLVKKYLPKLNIPEDRKAFLELLLCNKKF